MLPTSRLHCRPREQAAEICYSWLPRPRSSHARGRGQVLASPGSQSGVSTSDTARSGLNSGSCEGLPLSPRITRRTVQKSNPKSHFRPKAADIDGLLKLLLEIALQERSIILVMAFTSNLLTLMFSPLSSFTLPGLPFKSSFLFPLFHSSFMKLYCTDDKGCESFRWIQ